MNRLFISLIFISSIFSQQTTVAVLEFDAEGIDNVSSSALASIVRKEVIKAANYKLVDRNSMNEILVEQGLSQSGCVSSECAVEVGKLLGVQQMISGTLSALGSLYLLDINIIDVTTGEIIKTESVEHIGKIEELISPLRKTVKSMLGGSSLNVGEALVYIESIPSGAMVYMNGISVGSAPLKHTIDTKSYNITLKADGYADWVQTIQGKSGETVIVKAELLESRASSGGGLASNEIGKWEVLGISRSDYVDFLRLGIDERDWIENIQPAGFTINDLKEFYKYNIPKEAWYFIKKNDFSLQFSQNLIRNKIPLGMWFEYRMLNDSIPDLNESLTVEYFTFFNQISWLISNGIIDNKSYSNFVNEFGSDAYNLFFITNPSDISEPLTIKIVETFKDKTLNAKNINPKFLSFKQQLLNDYFNSDKYKYEDFEKFKKSVIEINIWQWLVLTNLNVPSKYYIIFFYNPHPDK